MFLSMRDVMFLSMRDIMFLSMRDVMFLSMRNLMFLSIRDVMFLCMTSVKMSHGNEWSATRENLSFDCANNKGTYLIEHPRRLFSAFVIRFLECIISRLATINFHFLSVSL